MSRHLACHALQHFSSFSIAYLQPKWNTAIACPKPSPFLDSSRLLPRNWDLSLCDGCPRRTSKLPFGRSPQDTAGCLCKLESHWNKEEKWKTKKKRLPRRQTKARFLFYDLYSLERFRRKVPEPRTFAALKQSGFRCQRDMKYSSTFSKFSQFWMRIVVCTFIVKDFASNQQTSRRGTRFIELPLPVFCKPWHVLTSSACTLKHLKCLGGHPTGFHFNFALLPCVLELKAAVPWSSMVSCQLPHAHKHAKARLSVASESKYLISWCHTMVLALPQINDLLSPLGKCLAMLLCCRSHAWNLML